MTEPRKASDVLLALETKIDQLLGMHKTLDHNIKLLSNKVNNIMLSNGNLELKKAPEFTIEAPKTISIIKENQLSIEQAPVGFRRTSRPETFEQNNTSKDIPTSNIALASKTIDKIDTSKDVAPIETPNLPKISIHQRIVDKTGKAIYLANVNIKNLTTGESIYKGRTNNVGKYSALLPLGDYSISITKSEALDKPKIDELQKLIVDGASNPLNLQTLIIK